MHNDFFNKFIDNTGKEGGVINSYRGTVTIIESEFIANKASSNGGGIAICEGTVTVTNSKFIDNTGNYGGGINNWEGKLTISGGEFRGNKATRDGGGIDSKLTDLTVTDTVFSGNTARQAYWMNNATDIATYNAQIKGVTKFSAPPAGNKPFQYAYNNYDIGYTKGLTSNR